MFETQIMPTVISADLVNDPDTLAMVAASAAVVVSDIPFAGPIAAVRVGRVDGQLIANPTLEQMAESDLEIVVSGSREAVMMVEGEADFLSEDEMLEAIFFGHQALQPLIDVQLKLAANWSATPNVNSSCRPPMPTWKPRSRHGRGEGPCQAANIRTKQERYAAIEQVEAEMFRRPSARSTKDATVRSALSSVASRKARGAADGHQRQGADRRPRHEYGTADQLRSRRASPRPRQRPVHPRRNPGPGGRRPSAPAATSSAWTISRGWNSRNSCCITTSRPSASGETSMRLFPGRREIGHGMLAERSRRQDSAQARRLPLHHPHRLRHPRVQRLFVDGQRLRRLLWPDGRRCAGQRSGGRDRHGADQGRGRCRRSLRHPRRRGPPRRHGLQGHRHRRRRRRAADGHQDHRRRPGRS